MNSPTSNVHFGGPDVKKNLLRDVLLESIQKMPASSQVSWMCYYLNDSKILNALVDASKRGVSITLLIDATPRIPKVNQTSIQYLRKHADPSITLIDAHKKPLWEYVGLNWHPHFHTKLYYFSHPTPHVLIGSYNPTAGTEELPQEFITQIGDHSISHNVLVKIVDKDAVSILKNYADSMHKSLHRTIARILPTHNRRQHQGEWAFDFLPRLSPHPINKLLHKNAPNAVIKCAISHLKGPGTINALSSAIKSGNSIEILLDASERRVSQKFLSFLKQKQINYYQPLLPDNCLMHNKFILYEDDNQSIVMFGSYNWSTRSKFLNHELIAHTTNNNVIAAFKQRWQEIITNN